VAVAELELIAAQVSTCQKCPLAKGRIKAVPGEGPADAAVMLIGEGPGYHENQQGRPFVGPAGQFLAELLAVAGLERADVFITNVVKCRPPGNRDPQPEEIAACSDYLSRQTAMIRPRVVVTLGRYSLSRFLPASRISAVHGQPHKVGGVTVFPMYHPAAALHQPTLRQTLLDDMAKLPTILTELERVEPERAPVVVEPPPEPPKQLSLF
jgi:uracil-DNA glycosylase family 4